MDMRDTYIDQTSLVTDAPSKIYEAEAKRFVLPLLLDIDKYKAVIIEHPLSMDANED
jgi:hypothetical protein